MSVIYTIKRIAAASAFHSLSPVSMNDMAICHQLRDGLVRESNAIMRPMWQRFHILSPTQVFGLSALCALIIAAAIGIASIPADGTPMYRFLAPSRELNPYINFGVAFVSVIPVLLSYYHLGRLGIVFGAAMAAFAAFATWLCAIVVFGFELLGKSRVIEAATYICVCLLITALYFLAHARASRSFHIQNAQRLMRLTIPVHRVNE